MLKAPWNTTPSIVLLLALAVTVYFVFRRVRRDYQELHRLFRLTAILQFSLFCFYAISSYAFLDSRLAQINTAAWHFPLAVVMMVTGLLLILFSMPFLGMRSLGHQTGRLKTNGLYRYSRNPQLVGFFLFTAGYALLWPSWQGAAWLTLLLWISFWMVKGEEEHLAAIFGDEYRAYCQRTPRYLGFPKSI